MTRFSKIFGRNRPTASSAPEPDSVRVRTGDNTIVANVLVRAESKQEAREVLEGIEILQSHGPLQEDHLRAASIISETYPFIRKARDLEPLSAGWIENLSNIIGAINDNADKYVKEQEDLGRFFDEIERTNDEE